VRLIEGLFEPPPRVVFYGAPTASLGLYLDGLPPDAASRIAVLVPRRLAEDLPILAQSGLVVFVRGFEIVWRAGLVRVLERLGVPCAWFTDDDLTALRGEQPGFSAYTEPMVKDFAAAMVALIGTTPALCNRVSTYHNQVLYWPCIFDGHRAQPEVRDAGWATRVAFVGGAFRVDGLRRCVVPALSVLPGPELLATDGPAARISGATGLPFEPHFDRFLAIWRAAEPDILTHPPGRTRNLAYKGPGVLLVASYLGAAPVVATEPAFAGLEEANGVLRAGDARSWRTALTALATPLARQVQLERFRAFARTTYTADPAQEALSALLTHAAPGGEAARRRSEAAQALSWRLPTGLIWRTRWRRLTANTGR